MRLGELPGGDAVTTVHLGPYETLGVGGTRLASWCSKHRRTPAGPPWAIYLDDPDAVAAAAVRTRLVQPLLTAA